MSAVNHDDNLTENGYRIVRRFGAGIPDGCSIPLSLKLEEDKQQSTQPRRKSIVQQQIEDEIVRRSYGNWSRRSVIAPWVYQEADLFQSEIIQKARQKADHHRSLLSKLRRSLFPKKNHKHHHRHHHKIPSSLPSSDGSSEHDSIEDPNSVSSSSLGFFVDPAVPNEFKANPELLLLNLPEPTEESDRLMLTEIKEGLRLFRRSMKRPSSSSAGSTGEDWHDDETSSLDDKENQLGLEMSRLGLTSSGRLNGTINFTPNGVTFISSGFIHDIPSSDDDDNDFERTRL